MLLLSPLMRMCLLVA
jgi:hypothetical protein